MDITSKKNKIIDIKGLTGRLKILKNEAAMKRREKEKAKYEEKKRREKQRYHEKRRAQLAIQIIPDINVPSPGSSSSLLEPEIKLASADSTLSKGIKPKKVAEITRAKKNKTISSEEKRRKEREKKRRQRQKLKEDKAKHEEYCRKEREIYQKKKRLGKITLISEKNNRDQRIQRKQWRMRQQKRRMKLKTVSNFLINNSPPESPPESRTGTPDNQRPVTPGALSDNDINEINRLFQTKTPGLNTSTENKKLLNKLKRTEMRLSKTEHNLNIEKAKAERYKKKLQRKHNKKLIRKSSTTLTPNTKADIIVQRGDTKEIKKQLLFCEVLQEQIKSNVHSCSTEAEKQVASKIISGRVAKRYRVAGKMNNLISNHRYNRSLTQAKIMPSRKLRMEEYAKKIKKQIFDFFISDEVSIQTPGKKDCITVRQQKMQKRYLNDTLTNLYKKFTIKHQKVSFSTFCRYKPFWVIKPTVNARNTCLCVKHANFMFIFKKMQQLNQFCTKIVSIDDILTKICCVSKSDQCIFRQCDRCSIKENEIMILEENGKRTISYFKWETKTEKRIDKNRKEIEIKIQTKVSIECTIEELRICFKSNLKIIIPHHFRACHQQDQIRLLRDQITEKEAIINIDFSENYMCKFNEEIQSVHFGGSRRQISLHTGVTYLKNQNKELECISFCGVSNDLLHNACAVWAHLKPILTLLSERNISIFHFVSDGPTSQYKNKTNFQLMCYFATLFKINFLTWNYYEPGHGKSVADGVGGALKRVADQTISHGNSITSAKNFIESVRQNNSKILLHEITTSDINEIIELSKKIIAENAVPNTMKIRQVIWSHEKNTKLTLKHRSCFNCSTNSACDHFLLKPSEHTFDKLLLNNDTPLDSPLIFDIGTAHIKNIELSEEKYGDVTTTHKKNMESSDDEEDNIPLSHFNKKITLENRNHVMSVIKAEIKNGNWLLIQFKSEAKQGGKPLKYICQVIETENKFEGTFLRNKSTRDFQGLVYGFPDIVDIYEFNYEDIMGKLEEPKNYGRGLFKFKINTNAE